MKRKRKSKRSPRATTMAPGPSPTPRLGVAVSPDGFVVVASGTHQFRMTVEQASSFAGLIIAKATEAAAFRREREGVIIGPQAPRIVAPGGPRVDVPRLVLT